MDGDDLLAEAHAVSLPWDGSLEDLPSGWDEGFVRGMISERPHDALMAIAISVAPSLHVPEDGEYVFPGGLATLVVENGIGRHVEPNVWTLHRVALGRDICRPYSAAI